jgi:hypothetical protein
MRRIVDVEIDASNIGEVISVLVALKEKAAAVIEMRSRAAGIVVEDEIGIFIRLGRSSITQKAELRDDTGGILQKVRSARDLLKREAVRQYVVRSADAAGALGVGVQNSPSDIRF